MNTKIFLNKWLSMSGIQSRRKCIQLIKDGKVKVNNRIEKVPFTLVDPQNDSVVVNNQVVTAKRDMVYYAINKPVGYVSATKADDQNHPPIIDLIKSSERIFPIGRLDIESEGLLILTNDGGLTYRLTHPKFHADKQYQVLVEGSVSTRKLAIMASGVELGGKITNECTINEISQTNNGTWLEFTLKEGRNRQIRRMCGIVNLHVKRLIRTKIGKYPLGKLHPGQYKKITKNEITLLEQ